MNVQAKSVRDHAISIFEEEVSLAATEGVKARLRTVNDACADIVSRGGVPSPPGIESWIATNRPAIKLKKQTIYNLRVLKDGTKVPSSYSRIIDAWVAVPQEKEIARRKAVVPGAEAIGTFLTNSDLEGIRDPVVRHKIAIIIGQFNQLKNQAEMRKAIKEHPPVPRFLDSEAASSATANYLTLSEDELDALTDFLKDASVKRRGLEFNDVGSLLAKRVVNGNPLSRPGFAEAIRKILESFKPNFSQR